MKVSIITVVYNNEETIVDAIDSVLKQNYSDIEYIIIDGNSTDRTVDKIKFYKEKISILVSENDNGLYDAMNKGISLANGEIIGILNSDDLYSDEFVISNIVSKFKNDEFLDMVYGDLQYVDPIDISKVVRNWISKDFYNDFFEDGHVPPHPSLFLRRKVYEKIGLFNLSYKLAADYDFMLRAFLKHNFKSVYIPKVMVKMRLGGKTNKSLKNIIKGNLEILKSWKKNGLKIPIKLIPLRIFRRIIQFF